MSFMSSLRRATPPSVAVELAADHVSAASIDVRGGRATVAAYATEPLAAGAVVPSFTTSNIHDRAEVIGALGRLFDRLGGRPRRIGLVVPDPAAKVSLVRFEQVPAKRQDLDQLVRWQVRKTAPFPIDEAQVSYRAGATSADGQEFVVSIARRDIVEEYEQVCAEVGAHAGVVDIATFNIINAVLAGSAPPPNDWLLVNVKADYASIAILRGEHLIFFRNRTSDTDGSLIDLVHQTAMYYEDRLSGSGFGRVLLVGGAVTRQAAEVAKVRRSLEDRLTSPVEIVDPRQAAALTDRISAAPALLERLAPLVGLLLRGRDAA
jgi:Tfp pilus assembly PilM family ATPase